MIAAKCVTNLDGKFLSWSKFFNATFPAMPSVGQVIMWNDMRCKIVEIRWEMTFTNEMQLVVEFNK